LFRPSGLVGEFGEAPLEFRAVFMVDPPERRQTGAYIGRLENNRTQTPLTPICCAFTVQRSAKLAKGCLQKTSGEIRIAT